MVWSEDTSEEMIAVLESTSRLERLTDEIVSFVDRDDDGTAEQVDDPMAPGRGASHALETALDINGLFAREKHADLRRRSSAKA